MIGLALVVFVSLNYVEAGYGMLRTPKWGFAINNKLAWFLMEFPVFMAMIILCLISVQKQGFSPARMAIFCLFEMHYLQRAIIFPNMLKGKNKMPLRVMFMGITFNVLNAMMQGWWLFFESYKMPVDQYVNTWLTSAPFLIGTALFLLGFIINLHADHIIRHLRKTPDDTKHYLPKGGLFNRVTSANYFGEIIEWMGFAILTWSLAGFVFFIWTCANLIPRAASIHRRYAKEFGSEMTQRKLKCVFPYLY
jgi:3-oxo-5-alpha-steroid 4-dehydrogenase 1